MSAETAWRVGLDELIGDLEAIASTRDKRNSLGLRSELPPIRILFIGDEGNGQAQAIEILSSALARLDYIASADVVRVSLANYLTNLNEFRNQANRPPERDHSHDPTNLPPSVWLVDGNESRPPNLPPLSANLSWALEVSLRNPLTPRVVVFQLGAKALNSLEEEGALGSHLQMRVKFPRIGSVDIAQEVVKCLADMDYTLPESGLEELEEVISAQPNLTLDDVPNFASNLVLRQGIRKAGKGTKQSIAQVVAEDIVAASPRLPREKTVEEVLGEFDQFIGMRGIRTRLEALSALAQVRRNNARSGKPLEIKLDHFVFAGPPGTGKTTVARKLGELLAALGMLRSGHVVSRDRASLVGQHVGHTEENVRKAIAQAKEGVLFIDEAYGLADSRASGSQDSGDFGTLAIQTLISAMTDPEFQPFVCVIAGYPQEMEKFINSNPGLASRFTSRIDFDPYSDEDLAEIFTSEADRRGLAVAPDARLATMQVLNSMRSLAGPNFGNARDAINLLDKSIEESSRRVVGTDGDNAVVDSVTAQDVLSARAALGLGEEAVAQSSSDTHAAKSILAETKKRIDAESQWPESARAMLRGHIEDVQKGNLARQHGSLPRTVHDILLARESGVDPMSLAEILAHFYSALGHVPLGPPRILNVPEKVSEEELIALTDDHFEKARGRSVVINDLGPWLSEDPPELGPHPTALALADCMRRYRNETLVVAVVDNPHALESDEIGERLLLGEFELIVD